MAAKLCFVAVLALLVGCSSAQSNLTVLLYEEDGSGKVILDLFDDSPRITNLIPLIGNFNPSGLLDSCANLKGGRFPVYGDCAKYLECIPTGTTYTRRIVSCLDGLWYNHYTDVCELRTEEFCTMGRLVPNFEQPQSANPVGSRMAPAGACTQPGLMPMPGCRGYIFCRQTDTGFVRSEYFCPGDLLWDETTKQDFCVAPSRVPNCRVPQPEDTCLRTCVAGEAPRTCRYSFVIHEFASMSSIYCGECPVKLSDCNLPGCISAGGISKPLIAINRQMPGPTIQACRGDMLEIEVFNQLASSAVTIHWHGLHQRVTPHMDGVPYITQCPIHPGNSFRYRMEADISGTHMYHSHIGHQESDGLFGAMIIREPVQNELGINSRYDVDVPDHRALFWHWFKRAAETESLDTRLMTLRREGFDIIINGKGVVGRRYGSDGNPLPAPIETYRLTSGRRHRFRSIFNTALNCPIQVSIDSHRLDIIAIDGRPVRQQSPLVESFILTAGERIDFVPVPTIASTTNQAFYLRARGLNDCDDQKNGVHQYAILQYDNNNARPAAPAPPPTYGNAIRYGNAFNLARPISNSLTNSFIQHRSLMNAKDANTVTDSRIIGTPNKRFYIDATFNRFFDAQRVQTIAPQLNNISWGNPTFPLLTQRGSINENTFCSPRTPSSMPSGCTERQCRCPHILESSNFDLVEVVLADPSGFNDIGHPFHLHGYAFRVVAQFASNSRMTMDQVRAMVEAPTFERDFNGPLKDTVVVPGRGFTVIRFVSDNPGYWLFHCHISEHMAQGMALAFKVGFHSEMVAPPPNFPTCGNYF